MKLCALLLLFVYLLPVVSAEYDVVSTTSKENLNFGETLTVPIFFPGNGSLDGLKFDAYLDESLGVIKGETFGIPLEELENAGSNWVSYTADREWLKYALRPNDVSNTSASRLEIGNSSESGTYPPILLIVSATKNELSEGDHKMKFFAIFSELNNSYVKSTELIIHVPSYFEKNQFKYILFGLIFTLAVLLLSIGNFYLSLSTNRCNLKQIKDWERIAGIILISTIIIVVVIFGFIPLFRVLLVR